MVLGFVDDMAGKHDDWEAGDPHENVEGNDQAGDGEAILGQVSGGRVFVVQSHRVRLSETEEGDGEDQEYKAPGQDGDAAHLPRCSGLAAV